MQQCISLMTVPKCKTNQVVTHPVALLPTVMASDVLDMVPIEPFLQTKHSKTAQTAKKKHIQMFLKIYDLPISSSV